MESMKLLMICFVSSLYLVLAKLMQEQYTATHPHLEIMVRITWCSSSLLCMWDYKGKNTLPLNPHHEGAHREYHPQHVHVIWKTFSLKLVSQEEDPTWSEIVTWGVFPVFTLSACSYHRLPTYSQLGNHGSEVLISCHYCWQSDNSFLPEVRHICRSSLAAWGQLLLRSAAFSSERDLSK